MKYKNLNFPAITVAHMRDAKLFADRTEMIASFQDLRGGVIGEVGVALGEFSAIMAEQLKPSRFYAFDTFDMHNWPEHWGRSSKEIFGEVSHQDFYAQRSESFGVPVTLVPGLSYETLARFENDTFDMLYIDAGHKYEDVRLDAQIAVRKLKLASTIIFNDYIMFDHLLGKEYGVVQAVNELVAEGEWFVVGFALQHNMFCDIALRRFG
jgi:hypothetical protein